MNASEKIDWKRNWAFQPKLVECLRDYSRQKFAADLAAGVTVGIVAIPLAMAFGIASGVTPQAGIFTAIIAGFLISALGGSRVQVGGPTGAFVVIVFGVVSQYGLENLLVCTIMAGVFLLIMGATRMGSMIKYIPYPVTAGFTAGIAVLIFSTQIKDFLGLQMETVPPHFIEKMTALGLHFRSLHWITLMLAAGSLALIVLWPKSLARRVPGTIVAVILGTALIAVFQLPVETIGSRFGGIPQGLPHFRAPNFSWENLRHLFSPALTIALLAAIESLLSAVVADGMINDKHDSNQELMAQGVANIVTPFFGGIPATGAIARTATNVKSGAVSPVAGIVHAATLLLLILVAAPLAKFIPLATLSAVLVFTAFNMAEWREFARLRKIPKSDAAVFITTFALTVIVDLTVAVEVGMVLAAALFVKRIAENTQITAVDNELESDGQKQALAQNVPPGVMVFHIFGAFFFGAAEKLETALARSRQEPEVLVLRMRKVIAMDTTGLDALESLHERLVARHKHLILCAPHTQPYLMMDKAGFIDRLGRENVVGELDEAYARAREILGEKQPPQPSTQITPSHSAAADLKKV